jgi:hypothetical protein
MYIVHTALFEEKMVHQKIWKRALKKYKLIRVRSGFGVKIPDQVPAQRS